VSKDFIRGRIKATGERAGVKVTPHQLRHTYATQLLNAGCKITTIQALLGHRHLNTTLTYARVHDRTVADDYFAAMATIEERLRLPMHQAPFDEFRACPEQSAVASTHQPANGTAESAYSNRSDQLLTLVNALDNDRLDEQQRTILAELRHNLLALAEPLSHQPLVA
jgi:hypothetical protein